ncbi:MAG: ATP-binding cassette domain-containing protein [Thermomicrobiales bacterium]|nr:ATP-binding cassette domain-containing protein [Thermomicrobiales bacterium]
MPSHAPAIVARELTKRFGSTRALDGVNLSAEQGTILGILGPNGAGKTTTVRILTTLLRPDAGEAFVAGVDVLHDPDTVRRRIGLAGQYASVDELISGRENLTMVGRLFHLPRQEAHRRADELLERFDLVDAADRPVKTYSGGMRRRLDLAASLIPNAPVLFLDEPTTGLDPRSRLELWGIIREQTDKGGTVLLTTQYLDEADQLADNIIVIDRGQVIASGSADELKDQVSNSRLDVTVAESSDIGAVARIVESYGSGTAHVDLPRRLVSLAIVTRPGLIQSLVRDLDELSIEVDNIHLRRPTLDDVFLALTGEVTTNDDDDKTNSEAAA